MVNKSNIQSAPSLPIGIPLALQRKIGYDVIIKVQLKSGNLASVQIVRPIGPSGPIGALKLYLFLSSMCIQVICWTHL